MSLKKLFWGWALIATTALSPAQQLTNTPAGDTNTVAVNPTVAAQASDDVMKKLSDLVHAGKYAEAQQLTSGLLLAYPDDQRLIKGKTLLEKLLATDKPTDVAKASTQPTNTPPQPATNQLTGMDKVEYNSLIELGREAQQATDLDQQKVLLQKFMADSSSFLQMHPNEILIWQLRAASAISVNNPLAGYEAGQKLLASGLAENNLNIQRLLAQLNLKGWLNHSVADNELNRVEKEKKYSWILGSRNVSWSWKAFGTTFASARGKEMLVLSGSSAEGYNAIIGYQIDSSGAKCAQPDLAGNILNSGEISWKCYLPPGNPENLYIFRYYGSGLNASATIGRASDPGGFFNKFNNNGYSPGDSYYPSGWQPVISCETDETNGTVKMVIPLQSADPKSLKPLKNPVTLIFKKDSNLQNQ